jgi:hypothetical protein
VAIGKLSCSTSFPRLCAVNGSPLAGGNEPRCAILETRSGERLLNHDLDDHGPSDMHMALKVIEFGDEPARLIASDRDVQRRLTDTSLKVTSQRQWVVQVPLSLSVS